MLIDHHSRNKEFLQEAIDILKKSIISGHATIRADVNALIKELTTDYAIAKEKSDAEEKNKHYDHPESEGLKKILMLKK